MRARPLKPPAPGSATVIPTTAPVPTRDGAAALLQAGVEVMAEQGYHGSSIRDIARRANMSTANLYHHFGSKQELLFRIMVAGIDDLLEASETGMAEAPPDPASQLRALVIAHVVAHSDRSAVSFVTFQEIRHLTPADQDTMRARMDAQQRRFNGVVDEGIAAGMFRTERPRETARAMASMCTAVATWFNPRGPRTPMEIAEHYVDLSLAMLGASR
jgi:AcrR family transcriptional regulator